MSLFPQTRAALERAATRSNADAAAALQILDQCDTLGQAGGAVPLPLLTAAIRVVVEPEWLAHRSGDADVIAFHSLADAGLEGRSADEADETFSRVLRARFGAGASGG